MLSARAIRVSMTTSVNTLINKEQEERTAQPFAACLLPIVGLVVDSLCSLTDNGAGDAGLGGANEQSRQYRSIERNIGY